MSRNSKSAGVERHSVPPNYNFIGCMSILIIVGFLSIATEVRGCTAGDNGSYDYPRENYYQNPNQPPGGCPPGSTYYYPRGCF